ncbi:hypothetical protein A5813_002601 [Enterococcus faecium]|nr:hypothetical protein [Enterococcus faecium]EGP5181998.1 hypothetical protein [Enterococcus faecium]OTO51158.1 hypothetical protein A5813_002601 [Enterococcus faecium]OTO57151.1 hypothetical protein A5812_002637 [Enterococcus faecium]
MKKHVALFSSVLMMSTTLLGAGSVFAASENIDANPATTSTPVQAVLELPNSGGTNPTPPTPPVDPGNPDPDNPGNVPNDPNGAFGMAYQPDVFNFGTVSLKETGTQEINAKMPTTGDNKFHVGVKDKTRETKGWTLKAKLTGSLSEQDGVSIEIGNGSGDVKVNNDGNLVNAPEGTVTGQSSVSAGKTEALVMSGTQGKIHNDVYDYELGAVKIKIQDAKTIQAKDYRGSAVQWNLERTPGA